MEKKGNHDNFFAVNTRYRSSQLTLEISTRSCTRSSNARNKACPPLFFDPACSDREVRYVPASTCIWLACGLHVQMHKRCWVD